MAYVTYYTAHHTNLLNEDVHINIMRKDGVTSTVPEELEVLSFIRNSEADSSDLYAPIIKQNIELRVHLTEDNTITWETFFEYEHDDWKIEVTVDEQPVFYGWMMPDEGRVPFEDKPYELTIRGADGLGLLKNIPLSKADGTDFRGKFTLIQYIGAILQKVLYNVSIKVTCDIFEVNMFNKYNSTDWDMFQQAKLDHRTFMKSATEYVSCYEALEIILKEHFRLFFDYDPATDAPVWHIFRIPQYQYDPYVRHYVLYDYDGTNPNGFEDPENYGQVGKHHIVYKTNTATRSGKFAVKKTRTFFNYNIWPELPLNNKFERGASMGRIGNIETFQIDDWDYGRYRNQPAINSALPAVPATSAIAYRKTTYNAYDIEVEREIIMEGVPNPGSSPAGFGILMSDEIPVNAGDKFKVSYEWKASYNASGPGSVAMIFVKTAAGQKYFLEGTIGLDSAPIKWYADFGNRFVKQMWQIGAEDTQTYKTISIDPPVVPVDGKLYIAILAPGYTGHYFYMKSFNMEYIPMIAGGYVPVKGHFWERSQNANYIDQTDNQIYISDALPRAAKGCLMETDDTTATKPSWYRFGLGEQRHYMELANMGRYNTEYRRFWRFEGTFTGTKFSPENDQLNYQPLSFRKTYKFMDTDELVECVLIPPLQIDYSTGEIQAIFEEVKREAFADGTQTGDSSRFNYIFE